MSETGDPLPSLLRDVAHNREATILMAHLRQRFYARRQEGDEFVFIDREALLDEVTDHRPDDATNRAMDRKRADKAIDGLATAGVLKKTKDPDRFQILPIIETLMPIQKLRELWTWLMTQNGTAPEVDGAEDADEPDLLVELDEEDDA